MLMIFTKVLVFWFVVTGALLSVYARRAIVASWREPVLQRPVLIIESDDWGAGPPEQADALGNIARVLVKFSDCDQRRPLMTLGVVLATADGRKTLSSGSYQRQLISTRTHAELLAAISSGVEAGVFSLQLHGMEHFWPPALLAASATDRSLVAWLERSPEACTEDLPSPLQSRWVDASVLPARALTGTDVRQAAREEVAAFQVVFGALPVVAVPPTFVWNDDVECAWAEAGVVVVVTPGRRFETRDGDGRPAGAGTPVYNGQRGKNNVVYLVRDVYFEPSFGHTAAQALEALSLKTHLGRPTLYETHRFNFIGAEENREQALVELESLLQLALDRYPKLAFLSSEKLASVLETRDPEWVDWRLRQRLHVWIARLGEFPRLRKLALLTGWIVPAGLLSRLTA